MKATISPLWESGVDIITDGSEFARPLSVSDLKKCDNIVVGGRIGDSYEVLIDEQILRVAVRTFRHPCGGSFRALEIY